MKKPVYGLYNVAADEWEFFILVTENLKLFCIYIFFWHVTVFFLDKNEQKTENKN